MIGNLILSCLVCLVMLFVSGCMGMLVMNRVESKSVSLTLILGFFVYFTLFQVIALLFKVRLAPLSYLSITWSVVIVAISIVAVIRCRQAMAELLGRFWHYVTGQQRWALLLMVLGTIAVFIFINRNMYQIAQYDAGYYLGLSTSSVYTNTIEQYDPYTGTILKQLSSFYLLNTYTIHSAVIAQICGLHPLLMSKMVMTFLVVLLFELIQYKTGQALLGTDGAKCALYLFLVNLTLLMSYGISGVSHYFAYRAYEGKTICAIVFLPAIFLAFVRMLQSDDGWSWRSLLFMGASGAAFCNTAIIHVPVMATICMAVVWARCRSGRRMRFFVTFALCMIPAAIWLVMQLLISKLGITIAI